MRFEAHHITPGLAKMLHKVGRADLVDGFDVDEGALLKSSAISRGDPDHAVFHALFDKSAPHAAVISPLAGDTANILAIQASQEQASLLGSIRESVAASAEGRAAAEQAAFAQRLQIAADAEMAARERWQYDSAARLNFAKAAEASAWKRERRAAIAKWLQIAILLLILVAMFATRAKAQDGSPLIVGGKASGVVVPSSLRQSGAYYIDCGASTSFSASTSTLTCPGSGSGSGTVTSVAETVPAWLAVAGSPVTAAGTLAITAAAGQTSHQVIGTCGTATAFAPCALVAGDIPTLNQSTTGNAGTATALAANGTNCSAGSYPLGVDASGNAESCTSLSPQKIRAIGYTFDGGGSALTSGLTKYLTVPFACALSAWNITVDTGTATVKTWKIATGTAIPTATNTLSTSGVSISTGTAIHSTTMTDFSSTAVTANDIFGFNLFAVSSATFVNFILECDQS